MTLKQKIALNKRYGKLASLSEIRAEAGRKGGVKKTKAKIRAAKKNGKKSNGRPKIAQMPSIRPLTGPMSG